MLAEGLINKGLKAKRESKYVDFKALFDPSSKGDWCEIIKDIVAMANTDGGVIIIGLNNDSTPSGKDVRAVLEIDTSVVTDKIHRYTEYQFSEFEIHECDKEARQLAAIVIFGIPVPMVFQKPGTYILQDGRQKTAFSKGTLYFRHGAKSEPGNMQDLQKVIERNLGNVRREWLKGVRKVIQAPRGSQVTVLSPDVIQSTSPEAAHIRVTNDPSAPEYRLVDPDQTHPYRQKELIEEVNARLPKGVTINTHDALSVRRVYYIHDRPEFVYDHKFGSSQYSQEFADWLIERYYENVNFFLDARQRYAAGDY